MICAVFADAVGFHYLHDSDIKNQLTKVFGYAAPAQSFLAYSSGIHTSIWTSSHLRDHGRWLNYCLRAFPFREAKFSQVLWKLESLATFLSKRIRYNPDKYYIPRTLSAFFDRVEYDFKRPFDHKLTSIFDVMDDNNVDFSFTACRRVEDIESLNLRHEVNIAFLDEFDSLGHRCGPYSERVKERILRLLAVLESIRKGNENDLLVLFSDHGMHQIEERFDLIRKLTTLEHSGLRLGVDYLCFLDATLARFWLESEKAEKSVLKILSDAPGHVLSSKEMDVYKIPSSGRFGQLIFLANSGVEIFPNFFHPAYASFVKGMHGYIPSIRNAYGLFASTARLDCDAISLLDVSPTIVKHLGLEVPRTWRGTAHNFP